MAPKSTLFYGGIYCQYIYGLCILSLIIFLDIPLSEIRNIMFSLRVEIQSFRTLLARNRWVKWLRDLDLFPAGEDDILYPME